MMQNVRKYGRAPFAAVVIHGGPGAAGEMAALARELAADRGVIEPLQTALTIEGQVDELRDVLSGDASLPVDLVGFSWGAWLSFIFAAKYPGFVRKLILIGSGPFEEQYAAGIQRTRLSRLEGEERIEAGSADVPISRLGELFSKTDTFDCLENGSETVHFRADIFESIWKQASAMRKNGTLLGLASDIRCPVVAIHGDYDPHPAGGVKDPLERSLKHFRFVLLKNCGHKPWIERHARDRFYDILKSELVRNDAA